MSGRKYQFMEQNLQRRVIGLKDKLPDIQKTLDTVEFLKTRSVCFLTELLAVLSETYFPVSNGLCKT